MMPFLYAGSLMQSGKFSQNQGLFRAQPEQNNLQKSRQQAEQHHRRQYTNKQ
jgi:hypothetical protein